MHINLLNKLVFISIQVDKYNFRVLFENVSDSSKLEALMKFEFYPALPVDSISSSIFGELIRGAGSKLSSSPLSQRSARAGNLDMDQAADSVGKERPEEPVVEKNDQSTQTDKITEHATKGQCDQITRNLYVGYSDAKCDQQQYLAYPQCSSPRLECTTMPYYTIDTHTSCNPPPGFSVYPQGVAQPYQNAGNQPQPAQMQMNPCVLTGAPLYAQGASYQQPCNNLAAPPGVQLQNTQMNQSGVPVPSDSSSLHQSDHRYSPLGRKSCAVPITSPESELSINHPPNELSNHGILIKQETVSIVNAIPLPIGPSLTSCAQDKEIVTTNKLCCNLMDTEVTTGFSNESDVMENKVESQVEQPWKYTAVEAIVENYDTVNEPEEKCVKLEKKADIEKFEELLERTNELLMSSDVSEINTVQNLPSTIDSKAQLKSCNVDRDLQTSNVKVCNNDVATVDDCHGDINTDEQFSKSKKDIYLQTAYKDGGIQHMEIDQMLSHIGQDFKEKLAEGRTIISPIKPLRRPLRLPWNLLNESKSKVHPVHALGSAAIPATDSSSEVQALGQARVNTEVYTALHSEVDEILKMDAEITHFIKSEGLYQNPCDFGKVMTNTDTNNNAVDAEKENQSWPNVLDINASSCLAETDVMMKDRLSRNEATKKNKETLQSQTKWFKGYLQQRLPGSRGQTSKDEERDVRHITKAAINVELESEINVEDEREQTSMIMECDVEQTEQSTDVNCTGAQASVKENRAINPEQLDVSSQKNDKVLEEMGNRESVSNASTEMNGKENSDPRHGKNLPERRTDISNLKNAVKGFLGNYFLYIIYSIAEESS